MVCVPASSSTVIMLVSLVTISPSIFMLVEDSTNTRISVLASVIVNVIDVEDSIFKHRVRVRPLYVTVPLDVERLPLIVKKLDVFPLSVKL